MQISTNIGITIHSYGKKGADMIHCCLLSMFPVLKKASKPQPDGSFLKFFAGLSANDFINFVLIPVVVVRFVQKDQGAQVAQDDVDTMFDLARETTHWGYLMYPDPDELDIDVGDIRDTLVL